MNAIRADELPDNTHSIYVDQWDWEKVITAEERNMDYLHEIVNLIFITFREIEILLQGKIRVMNVFCLIK